VIAISGVKSWKLLIASRNIVEYITNQLNILMNNIVTYPKLDLAHWGDWQDFYLRNEFEHAIELLINGEG
jgi:hypothetical protein